MNCTLNQRGILLNGRIGAKIENERCVTRLQHLTQLRGRDSRHAQILQEPLALPVFISDEKHYQSNQEGQSAAPDARKRGNDLVDLTIEEKSKSKQTASVEQ